MRSLTDLQTMCRAHGIVFDINDTREQLMDFLRAQLGTFDPAMQIDPMKASDLKNQVAWHETDPSLKFKGIGAYLNDKWVADAKLDGTRGRIFLGATANTIQGGRRSDVTMAYRDWSDNFPHIRDLVVPELSGTILDGEMMPPKDSITSETGVVTKGTLASIMSIVGSKPEVACRIQAREGNAVFVAFDILAVQGEDVRHLQFSDRRVLLEKVMDALDRAEGGLQRSSITLVPQMAATAENIQACLDAGLEGVILKHKGGTYEPGKRSKVWQKVKRMSTGDFVVFGSVPGKGRNEGKVGSMKVAYWTGDERDRVIGDDGLTYAGLVYCADVAGISDSYRADLTGPDGKLDPKHFGRVIEVQAQGRTKGDRLRHPIWVRDRADKRAFECEAACSIDLFEEV